MQSELQRYETLTQERMAECLARTDTLRLIQLIYLNLTIMGFFFLKTAESSNAQSKCPYDIESHFFFGEQV